MMCICRTLLYTVVKALWKHFVNTDTTLCRDRLETYSQEKCLFPLTSMNTIGQPVCRNGVEALSTFSEVYSLNNVALPP